MVRQRRAHSDKGVVKGQVNLHIASKTMLDREKERIQDSRLQSMLTLYKSSCRTGV